jgi:hypothetical protein
MTIPDGNKKILCTRCVLLFGAENAQVATIHGDGVLAPKFHLCFPHYFERNPSLVDSDDLNGGCDGSDDID